MTTATLGRLLEVIRRATGASRVELIDADVPAPADTIRRELPSGRSLLVHVAPGDEAREGRLDALVASFGGLLDEARDDWGEPGNDASERLSGEGRPDRGASLVAELRWLAHEAGASEALVIDAHSPVVWGSSHGLAAEEALEPALRLVSSEGPMDAPDNAPLSEIAQQTVREVRARPEVHQLPRGGHLRHVEMSDERGYLVRSFADIYLVLLLYPGRFDEVAAERLLHSSLPRIEHWVLGLPPPGPEAGGSAQAARNPRR